MVLSPSVLSKRRSCSLSPLSLPGSGFRTQGSEIGFEARSLLAPWIWVLASWLLYRGCYQENPVGVGVEKQRTPGLKGLINTQFWAKDARMIMLMCGVDGSPYLDPAIAQPFYRPPPLPWLCCG